jgi:hypothetical protein
MHLGRERGVPGASSLNHLSPFSIGGGESLVEDLFYPNKPLRRFIHCNDNPIFGW